MYEPDLKKIPKTPGVYFYHDKDGKIIYIGKAKDLRNRVSSYFRGNHENSPKTQFLLTQIASMDTISVDSEVEALLLENKLIKQHKPKYNILLKDSKTFAYIKITDDKIPKIVTSRKVSAKGTYFGPYTDNYLRRELFSLTVSLFKLVTNQTYSTRSRLNYDMGKAPAASLEEIDREWYLNQVKQAKAFLSGKGHDKIAKDLEAKMLQASLEMRYEEAQEIKKQLESLSIVADKQKVDQHKNYDQGILAMVEDDVQVLVQVFSIVRGVLSGKKEYRYNKEDFDLEEFVKMYYSSQAVPHEILLSQACWDNEEQKEQLQLFLSTIGKRKLSLIVPQRGEKLALVKLALKNAKLSLGEENVLTLLKEKLNLPRLPRVIECFDMSNLGATDRVGGMTRFVNAQKDTNGYRRFEIKSFEGKQDDFASMKEVLYRRYKRLRDEQSEMPDLIIVDGGKGQLSSSVESLLELGLNLPIISLAKQEEEIFVPGRSDSYKFPKNSPMMLFIRMIRDTTHDYVISYNRQKRKI